MIIVSQTQFHIYLLWGQRPSRGLLRDYEPSDGPSFQALIVTGEIPYFRMLIICCVQYESSQYEMSLTIYEYNFIYWKIIGEAKVKFEWVER